MDRTFTGIHEKLVRAYENIRNLDTEVARFFESSDYPVFPYQDKQALAKALDYHERRPIPLRFSVLSGEIVHQLRSCLDHVSWALSAESYRLAHPTVIEFPIFKVPPTRKKSLAAYERKIKGIRDPGALILIELLQPYNSPDPLCSSLWIVHDMDITDKHRGLVLCVPTPAIFVPMDLFNRFLSYERGEPGSVPVDVGAELHNNPQILPQIAFREFGGRGVEPIVQGLTELHNFVVQIVQRFEALSSFVGRFPY